MIVQDEVEERAGDSVGERMGKGGEGRGGVGRGTENGMEPRTGNACQ